MVEQTTAVVLLFDINRCLGRSKVDKLHVSDPYIFSGKNKISLLFERASIAIVWSLFEPSVKNTTYYSCKQPPPPQKKKQTQ